MSGNDFNFRFVETNACECYGRGHIRILGIFECCIAGLSYNPATANAPEASLSDLIKLIRSN